MRLGPAEVDDLAQGHRAARLRRRRADRPRRPRAAPRPRRGRADHPARRRVTCGGATGTWCRWAWSARCPCSTSGCRRAASGRRCSPRSSTAPGSPRLGVIAIEVGGVNGIVVFVAAAELGLPVIDADLQGRAPAPDRPDVGGRARRADHPARDRRRQRALLILDGMSPPAERAGRPRRRSASSAAGPRSRCARCRSPTSPGSPSPARSAAPSASAPATPPGHRGARPAQMAAALGAPACWSPAGSWRWYGTAPGPGFGRGSVIIKGAPAGGTPAAPGDGERVPARPRRRAAGRLHPGHPVRGRPGHRRARPLRRRARRPRRGRVPPARPARSGGGPGDRDAVGPRAFGLDIDPVPLARTRWTRP